MFAAYQNCTDFKWSTNLFKPFWIMSNCLSDADASPCLYLRIKDGLSPTKRANSDALINGKARKNAVKSYVNDISAFSQSGRFPCLSKK